MDDQSRSAGDTHGLDRCRKLLDGHLQDVPIGIIHAVVEDTPSLHMALDTISINMVSSAIRAIPRSAQTPGEAGAGT